VSKLKLNNVARFNLILEIKKSDQSLSKKNMLSSFIKRWS